MSIKLEMTRSLGASEMDFFLFISEMCHVIIVLINVALLDAKGLSSTSEVELLREKVYASLEAYCKQKYPEQQGR